MLRTLDRGVDLRSQNFANSCVRTSSSSELVCYGVQIAGVENGYFKQPGEGYIGFVYGSDANVQYGWARIKITGDPLYRFVVLDYALGDPKHERSMISLLLLLTYELDTIFQRSL